MIRDVVMVSALFLCVGVVGLWRLIRRRNMNLWLGSYLSQIVLNGHKYCDSPIDLFVCVTDHFEPGWQKPAYGTESQRVGEWCTRYPVLARKHKDCSGRYPQHTFFYPEEEYRPEHLEKLAKLCREGFGDVEVHLHHDGDTAEGLRDKLLRYKAILHEKHGLLRRNHITGEIEYAFIHGNWTLDNSGHKGKYCGVNDELIVLRETGCYADFTFPSAPSETQPSTINKIYYATDDPARPKSHDVGIEVEVGKDPSGDLLIVQGPLTLNWRLRKWGIFPKIENGELSGDNPPSHERVDLWVRQHIHVKGKPNWVFIKLHTHGAEEGSFEALLGKPMEDMLAYMESTYNDGVKYRLHYVTAREIYLLIKAAESKSDVEATSFLLANAGARPSQY